jgi:hypothetical protein
MRDHHGRFIAGSCHFFPTASDLECAELFFDNGLLLLKKVLSITHGLCITRCTQPPHRRFKN